MVRRSRGVFAQRVLQFGEIHSLSINPARATATLSYRLADGDADGFPTRLAAAGAGEGMDEAELPHWPDGETVTLHRHLGIVSTIEILSLANGRLDARHPAMARDLTARRVENALRIVPGGDDDGRAAITRAGFAKLTDADPLRNWVGYTDRFTPDDIRQAALRRLAARQTPGARPDCGARLVG